MSTLNVDKVDPSTGTALEIGSSGDTVTVPSGATFNVAGTMQSGGVTVANTPAVLVTNSGDQSIATASNTLVTFDTETIDTDSAFASNTFTVPSGEDGMYGIFARGSMTGIDAGEFTQLRIYLNGSASAFFENRLTAHDTDVEVKYSGGGFLNLAATNTISMYWYQNSGDSQNLNSAGLYIFKLIGA